MTYFKLLSCHEKVHNMFLITGQGNNSFINCFDCGKSALTQWGNEKYQYFVTNYLNTFEKHFIVLSKNSVF